MSQGHVSCSCQQDGQHDTREQTHTLSYVSNHRRLYPESCDHSHLQPLMPLHCHHTHGTGCCHEHTPPQTFDPKILNRVSATRAVYRIMNMDCPMEEALIRKKLQPLPGIEKLEFNLMQRVLTVTHALPDTKPIEAALKSIGMTPENLGSAKNRNKYPIPESQIPWKKLTIAGMFAIFSECLELVHEWHAKPFDADIQNWTFAGHSVLEFFPLLCALAAIALSGLATYKKGWLAVSTCNLNINALMSVAVTGAIIIGQYPEAAMVMVLFNVSEAIESKALDRARKAIKNLLDLAPNTATILCPDGTWAEKDIHEISTGSHVRVKPGERIGLDGIVVRGRSAVNQAPITGESMPVEKKAGDPVHAGSVNESGTLEFEVTAAATDTTLARIIHVVEEAQGKRAPIQRFVDQFAQYYTPSIFLLSLLTSLFSSLFLDETWTESIYRGLVILVIGCPCALVISTPVTIVSGMATATRYGLLIKGGIFLEQGRLLKWLAVDKTGTITQGKPHQTDCIPMRKSDRAAILTLAASLAACSDHPVSRAIAGYAAEHGIHPLGLTDFTAFPGQGSKGVINGRTWFLGNRTLLEEQRQNSARLKKILSDLEQQGKTVVVLFNEKEAEAVFAVADTLRESSVEAIRDLKVLGVQTIMLTGDNRHAAEAIAAQVGVNEFKSGLLPEDKLHVIEELLQRGGKVGMVGDGINDAPALAKADIGFAMAGNGTDTAIETADVALMEDDLTKIPRFIRLSKATYAILIQNITLALGMKALFLALSFTGHATMWMAVFADVGTALLVVANGLRAMKL